MRHKLTVLLAIVAIAFMLAPQATSANAQRGRDSENYDYPEIEDSHQTFELQAGARVEISVISGPVTIETTDGNTAEVHIVRSAQTRTELDCYQTAVERSPNSLVIRHKQNDTSPCNNIRSRQRVTLKLPRAIDLKLSAISGPVKVDEIHGTLQMSGISGPVEVAQSHGYSDISGISGVLKINVSRLGERGIRVSGISGRVELILAEGLSADLSVSGINGDIDTEASNVTLNKVGLMNFRGRVGAGGSPISVSGISGRVVFRRS